MKWAIMTYGAVYSAMYWTTAPIDRRPPVTTTRAAAPTMRLTAWAGTTTTRGQLRRRAARQRRLPGTQQLGWSLGRNGYFGITYYDSVFPPTKCSRPEPPKTTTISTSTIRLATRRLRLGRRGRLVREPVHRAHDCALEAVGFYTLTPDTAYQIRRRYPVSASSRPGAGDRHSARSGLPHRDAPTPVALQRAKYVVPSRSLRPAPRILFRSSTPVRATLARRRTPARAT